MAVPANLSGRRLFGPITHLGAVRERRSYCVIKPFADPGPSQVVNQKFVENQSLGSGS